MAGRAIDPRKLCKSPEPTRSLTAKGHDAPADNFGRGSGIPAGTEKTSASHHMSHARKPGELGRGRLQKKW